MPSVGQLTSISTATASGLVATTTPVQTMVMIRANTANTGKLYLCFTSAATTGNGYEINAGQEVQVHRAEIPSADAQNVFLIAATSNTNIASYRII